MVSIWLGFYRNGKTKFYENKIVVNIVFSVGSPLYLEVYTVLHSEPSPPPLPVKDAGFEPGTLQLSVSNRDHYFLQNNTKL